VFERRAVDEILRRFVREGHVQVKYWDGSFGHYGDVNSDLPPLRVEITDAQVARKLLVNASLALGEGYTNSKVLVDEEQLPLLFELIARNQPARPLRQPFRRKRNHKGAQQGYIEAHYDVGNDYYGLFLGETMLYSCAYFASEGMGLDEAQYRKVGHLLRKLQPKPGMRVLDIGCGWGHLAVAIAKAYDAQVLGITLSDKQLEGARELAEREGVKDLVTFEKVNYQDLKGKNRFDRVISVGMFEHVGKDNRDQYFAAVNRLLVPGGVSVLHTITQQQSRPVDAWIDKYIFPGGYLPTVAEIEDGLAKHGLWSVDRENLWWHYAETLRLWRERHQANRAKIVEMFDEEFYRMRDLWLTGSEAGFRYGQLGLTQEVFTKGKPADGSWPRSREYQYDY